MTRKSAAATAAIAATEAPEIAPETIPTVSCEAPARYAYIESSRFLCGTCGRNLYFNQGPEVNTRIMSCGNHSCAEFGIKYLATLPSVILEPFTA